MHPKSQEQKNFPLLPLIITIVNDKDLKSTAFYKGS